MTKTRRTIEARIGISIVTLTMLLLSSPLNAAPYGYRTPYDDGGYTRDYYDQTEWSGNTRYHTDQDRQYDQRQQWINLHGDRDNSCHRRDLYGSCR